MKRIAFVSLMLVLCAGMFAQEPLSFSKVIQTDSVPKDQIYFGVKEWVGTAFKSAKAVIEMDDKDAGLIIVRPAEKYNMKGLQYLGFEGYLRYAVKIQIREGRFRVELTNFTHENLPGNCKDCVLGLITTDEQYPRRTGMAGKVPMNKVWKDIKVKAENLANLYFAELEKIQFNSGINSQEDDW